MGFRVLIPAFCLLVSAASAVQPGFDANDVVRQFRPVHWNHRTPAPPNPSLDDGEFLIDTSVTIVPESSYQIEPAVAFDGVNYLVVWSDHRRGTGFTDIYGTRVTPQGAVLDPAGIAISLAEINQCSPAVSFDGVSFLVVWYDYRSGIDNDIYGARVTPQGTVLDPAGIAISLAPGGQYYPAVCPDGTNSLVVWEDGRGAHNDIYGARVTPQGTVLDPSGLAVSSAEDDQWDPAVVSDGTNALVVWGDYRNGDGSDIYGARVTPQGTVLDPAGIAISRSAFAEKADVGFDGSNFLVAWQDWRSESFFNIYAARVTPQGAPLDSAGFIISRVDSNQYDVDVGFDGTNLLVLWQEDHYGSRYDILGARVTPQGTVLDTGGLVISHAANDQACPATCFDGANSFVVWEDFRGSSADIYGARVDRAGDVLDPDGILLSTIADDQYSYAVAFDGENFLVAWAERNTQGYDVHGVRVNQAGVVLDPADIVISAEANNQWRPGVAFDGEKFLLAWEDERNGYADIYGTRVSRDGQVLDPGGIAIATAAWSQCFPAACYDGEDFFVTWQDSRRSPGIDIYGARVTSAGVVLDPQGIAISTADSAQVHPAVAFDGANALVVWEDGRRFYDVYGARVTPGGAVLDPQGIAICTTGYQSWPAIASDRTNSLVVWIQGVGRWPHIYGARASQDGVVLDTGGFAITVAQTWQSNPGVAFDGTDFFVAWEQYATSPSESEISGARVTSGGVVSDWGPVVNQDGFQYRPLPVGGTGNRVFLAYEGWAGTVGGKVYNTDRIWGKADVHVGVTEAPHPEPEPAGRGATIVRGVLLWEAYGTRHTAHGAELLDISGRKVLDLHAGPNDVSRLSPGVYFVRAVGCEPSAESCRKVVLAR